MHFAHCYYLHLVYNDQNVFFNSFCSLADNFGSNCKAQYSKPFSSLIASLIIFSSLLTSSIFGATYGTNLLPFIAIYKTQILQLYIQITHTHRKYHFVTHTKTQLHTITFLPSHTHIILEHKYYCNFTYTSGPFQQ